MIAKRTVLAVVLMAILVLALIVGCQPAPTPAPQPQSVYGGAVYFPPGGNQLVVGSGGEIEVQPGALLDIQAGATAVFSLDVVSNTTYLNVAAPTAVATTTPAAVIGSAGVSNILELRKNVTPVARFDGSGNAVLSGGLNSSGPGVVSAPTAVATATPAFVVNSAGVSNILEVRDAATPVFAIRNGGTAVLGSYTLAWSAPITISGVLTNVRVLYYQVP